MFEIKITSLHEFRLFVRLIRMRDVTDEEIQRLSAELGESADKLLAAETTQKEKET